MAPVFTKNNMEVSRFKEGYVDDVHFKIVMLGSLKKLNLDDSQEPDGTYRGLLIEVREVIAGTFT